VALLAGVVLILLALKGAPALEPPADPTSGNYVPRPDWYFFGLFELLKYFPGRWEVVGALVIPGLAVAFLALLPWLDRGRSREVRYRLPVLLPFAAGFLLIGALTIKGARDKPGAAGGAAWNIREIAGASLAHTSDRCVRCHKPDGAAAPIEAGAIRQTAAWLSAHVADPEVIAPGIREAPETNQAETHTIIAGLARMRTGPPPVVFPETLAVYRLHGRFCVQCHVIDGVGGKDGPDLSHVGSKLTLATIEQRIIDPLTVDPIAEMPAFVGKLTPEEIRRLAVWLSERK
jgi:mono/diheme cytochrome c family protein